MASYRGLRGTSYFPCFELMEPLKWPQVAVIFAPASTAMTASESQKFAEDLGEFLAGHFRGVKVEVDGISYPRTLLRI